MKNVLFLIFLASNILGASNLERPSILFITSPDRFINVIEDSSKITKILNYLKLQRPSMCMAEYNVYSFYSKDSMKLNGIFNYDCCSEEKEEILEVIDTVHQNNNWKYYNIEILSKYDTQYVKKTIKSFGAYPLYNFEHIIYRINFSKLYKQPVNRDSIWKDLNSQDPLDKLAANVEIKMEPCEFNVYLYFNNYVRSQMALKLIDKYGWKNKYEINTIQVRMYAYCSKTDISNSLQNKLDKIKISQIMECK